MCVCGAVLWPLLHVCVYPRVCVYPTVVIIWGGVMCACVQYPALTQVDWEIYFGREGDGSKGKEN